jgi:hypothetical protein
VQRTKFQARDPCAGFRQSPRDIDGRTCTHSITQPDCSDEQSKALQSDPDLAPLRKNGLGCPLTLAHLIHRKERFESNSKDHGFSRPSMTEHGPADMVGVGKTLSRKSWKSRQIGRDQLQIFDLGSDTNEQE